MIRRVWRNLRRGIVARWRIVGDDGRETFRGALMVHDYDRRRARVCGCGSVEVREFVHRHMIGFTAGEVEINYSAPTLTEILKL